MRLLLHNVRGPTSFESLKHVDGYQCATFHEACIRLDLLASDIHWKHTLQDASTVMMPKKMRQLFGVMFTNCEISNKAELWHEFKQHLAEDFYHQARMVNPETEYCDEIYN